MTLPKHLKFFGMGPITCNGCGHYRYSFYTPLFEDIMCYICFAKVAGPYYGGVEHYIPLTLMDHIKRWRGS